MDILGFLAGLAGSFILATRFPGLLAFARRTLALNAQRIRIWAGYAAASVGRHMLLAFAAVFAFAGVVAINAASALKSVLTAGPLVALFVALVGGLVWIAISLLRLWPTTYANFGDVWSLGTEGGLTLDQFEERYGPWQPASLSLAFWPIITAGLSLASACLWIKFQAVAAGVEGGTPLLLTKLVAGNVFTFTIGLVIGLPLAAIYFVTSQGDRFVDPVGISLLRAVMIFLPGVTEESFDTLTNGGTTLNIPMEQVGPAIKKGIVPPLAMVITIFFFALWVGDGLATIYLVTLVGAAAAASFCLWAFGAKSSDIAVKVMGALWGLILLSIVYSFLRDTGTTQAATTTVVANRSWFEATVGAAWHATTHLPFGWGLLLGTIVVIPAIALLDIIRAPKTSSWGQIATFVVLGVPSLFMIAGVLVGWISAIYSHAH